MTIIVVNEIVCEGLYAFAKKIIGNVTNLLGTIVTTLMPASPYDIIPLLQKKFTGPREHCC